MTYGFTWQQRPWIFYSIISKFIVFSKFRNFYTLYLFTYPATTKELIHEADPQPVVIIDFAHVIRSYVRQYVRPSVPTFKTKQISSENDVHYWRDYESGRVHHWWHLFLSFLAWICQWHTSTKFFILCFRKWPSCLRPLIRFGNSDSWHLPSYRTSILHLDRSLGRWRHSGSKQNCSGEQLDSHWTSQCDVIERRFSQCDVITI